MWMYAVREKETYAIDVTSLNELNEFNSKVDWLWVDVFNPNEKECEIIAELLGNEPTIVEAIKNGTFNPPNMHTRFEKIHDYFLLSIPSVHFEKQLRTYPIFVFCMRTRKMLVTWGEEQSHSHSTIIKSTIRRLREHVEEGGKPTSSLAIGMLFREIAAKNSDVMLSIKEVIDQFEEVSLKEAGKKHMMHLIFSIKRNISNLYRLLVNEKEFIANVKERIAATVGLNEKAMSIMDSAIDDINREIEFADSYDRSLSSILTLQDLASIHRVESSINYLTIILVILTVVLIALELSARLGTPAGGH